MAVVVWNGWFNDDALRYRYLYIKITYLCLNVIVAAAEKFVWRVCECLNIQNKKMFIK